MFDIYICCLLYMFPVVHEIVKIIFVNVMTGSYLLQYQVAWCVLDRRELS